ncbi:MAG TPA: DNA polymerase IV [Bryobacteraceae bacterium]|jgi:DNA polymerase-4|nr:DNA polymerase IV [Bryobacteraceae bacterium]
MQRLVCHVDMDAFFVSVEELFDPTLKGKPVVVGGKADQRGVVAAASYAARKFGVHSAMPLRTAGRLCPQAIFVEGHPERYREYSKKVLKVLHRFSPQIEMASIDEAYLDLTGTERLHGPPLRTAHALHEAIRSETNLRCSLGLASSRLVAKVSSDQAKPNGVLYILPGQEARFLAPLDVRKIPGVGKKTELSLHKLGIRYVGDLANLDESFLASHFGRWGLALAGKAKGMDAGGWFDAEIGAGEEPKSISHEHTFWQDVADSDQLETTLLKLSEMVSKRLREHRLYSKTIQLKLRYEDFSTITRASSLDHATQLDREVAGAVIHLFRKAWDKRTPVRLLGVHAGSLQTVEGQMNLLDEATTSRLRNAFRSVDHIRDRFGGTSISLAKTLHAGIRERVHENPFDLAGKTGSKDTDKDDD